MIASGGSGIGRAIALKFAAQGAKIHIPDLNVKMQKLPVSRSRPQEELPWAMPAM